MRCVGVALCVAMLVLLCPVADVGVALCVLQYWCCCVMLLMLRHVGVALCVLQCWCCCVLWLMLGRVSVVQCICNLGVADMCRCCTVCVAVFCC